MEIAMDKKLELELVKIIKDNDKLIDVYKKLNYEIDIILERLRNKKSKAI
jgi:hypothetical protein